MGVDYYLVNKETKTKILLCASSSILDPDKLLSFLQSNKNLPLYCITEDDMCDLEHPDDICIRYKEYEEKFS